MAFPEDVLTSDEEVVLHLHPHWKALLRPILVLALSLLMLTVGLLNLPAGFTGTVCMIVLFVLAVALIVGFALMPFLRWRTTHYVFTSERVLLQHGILSRDRRDVPLARVNDHAMTQRFTERLLGCGTLTIESAGERGQSVLADVPGVEKVQTTLYELVEKDRVRHHDPDAGQ